VKWWKSSSEAENGCVLFRDDTVEDSKYKSGERKDLPVSVYLVKDVWMRIIMWMYVSEVVELKYVSDPLIIVKLVIGIYLINVISSYMAHVRRHQLENDTFWNVVNDLRLRWCLVMET